MKIKTCEATPLQLNYLVAVCEGMTIEIRPAGMCGRPLYVLAAEAGSTPWTWEPSTSWHHGGPILERKTIAIFRYNKLDESEPDKWCGHKVAPRPNMEGTTNMVAIDGPTPLIAAMRCYVASELGNEVEIPEELCAN